MRRLGITVSSLKKASRAMRAAIANDDGRLGEMSEFGSNPGGLDARTYLPNDLPSGAPLVVVLHGCTQNASVYDSGSGWSKLADRHGFALLYPQQRRANNPNLCFNWYSPADARRGKGEALSISQMVRQMVATHRLDPARVFVTGLSAGGAMTAVMLAAYPDLFAGGAIIAGLPFASANSLPEALERMRGQGTPPRRELAARVRAAANHNGEGPTLSVWHGTRDLIVDSVNATAIVDQWRDLHDLGTTAGVAEITDGHRREVWRDARGRDIIEKYDVQGMGHGTPLDTRGTEACGTAGPHMLEANICSTRRIAAFWGLTGSVAAQSRSRPISITSVETPEPKQPHSAPAAALGVRGVGGVIEDALRAAGLMR